MAANDDENSTNESSSKNASDNNAAVAVDNNDDNDNKESSASSSPGAVVIDEKQQQQPPIKKTRKPQLPSVDYLLKHGDPETAHLPKTWCEIIGYPLVLAVVFAISLLIFHHAPKSPAKPMNLQGGVKRLSIFDRKRQSHPPHVIKKDQQQEETMKNGKKEDEREL